MWTTAVAQSIAGMTANLCCQSAGRHATEQGYDVTFVWDAIGAESLAAYEASIRVNYPLIANVVISVDEFLDGIGVGSLGSAVIWLALADRGPRDVTSDSRSAV